MIVFFTLSLTCETAVFSQLLDGKVEVGKVGGAVGHALGADFGVWVLADGNASHLKHEGEEGGMQAT